MKHLLLTTIAAVLVVGCATTQPPEPDRALLKAANTGNIEAVKQYIAGGADVNAKDEYGGTPLFNAAVNGHTETAELLIDKGADVNAKHDGDTPLDWAISHKHPETADLLRKHGGKNSCELKAAGN